MSPYVNGEVQKFSGSLIVEGAFLDPEQLSTVGKLVLVVTSDEQRHRAQYFQHREQTGAHSESFEAARMAQAYLVNEAKGYDVEIVENNF